jgi:GYF domain 2
MESYFIHDGIAPSGPYTLEELKNINIHADQAVWSPEMKVWIEAGHVLALQSIVKRTRKSFSGSMHGRSKQHAQRSIFILTSLILLVAFGLLFWHYTHRIIG